MRSGSQFARGYVITQVDRRHHRYEVAREKLVLYWLSEA